MANSEKISKVRKNPLISIIVPVYNTEKYLNKCINSILRQNFKDFELWLIDDGSKDGSVEIIKEYEAKDKRIKTGFIKGSGPAEPRNYGLRRATGDYILFVDSDDYLTENALDVFANIIFQFPEADFIRGNQRILIDGEREAKSVFADTRNKYANKILEGEQFLIDVLQNDYAPIDSIIKRDFLKKNNILFHEELVILEDGPFISEICASRAKCLYITDETYVYRLFTPGSATNSPKNLKKTLSLIWGGQYYVKASKHFFNKGIHVMKERASDHAVAGLYQACKHLPKREAKIVYNEIKKHFPKLYPSSSYNKSHLYFMKVYNISPHLAFLIIRLIVRIHH